MIKLSAGVTILILILTFHPVTCSPQSDDSPGVVTEDDCDYTLSYHKCGDICVRREYPCYCGNTTLSWKRTPTRHCCSDVPCTGGWYGASCPGGEVLDISKPCDGRCYADYETSKYLGYTITQYTCPGHDECLSMKSFCRGWCSAHLCNAELRCEEMSYGTELTSLKSEVIEEHWYCRNDRNLGDSIFNTHCQIFRFHTKKMYNEFYAGNHLV